MMGSNGVSNKDFTTQPRLGDPKMSQSNEHRCFSSRFDLMDFGPFIRTVNALTILGETMSGSLDKEKKKSELRVCNLLTLT